MASHFESGGLLPPDRQARLLRYLPYAFMAAVVVADLATPRDITFSSTLSVAPALAALGSRRPGRTIVVGVLAAVTVVGMSLYSRGIAGDVEIAAVVAVFAVTAVSCASVTVLQRQHLVLTNIRSVAEAAQHVLLRDIPPELTQVRSAVRYEAAAAEARIGGDLYEAMCTPFGDRLIIGDVRGKGLPAVEAASDVLGIFREAAHQEPDLAAVASRINAGLARRSLRDEEFVTAVLICVPPGLPVVEIVNCGHPPPMLIHHGAVQTLDPPEAAPPLGLFDLVAVRCAVHYAAFEAGDAILLYTDGTTEARDADGDFYHLAKDLSWATFDSPDALVDHVLSGLRLHAGPRLDDDVALLAIQRMV
jgi:serine phosphatase RsbU (regulator of sigma subunit)